MSGDGLTDIDLTRVPGRAPGLRRRRDHGRQGGRRPVAVRRRRARRRHARRRLPGEAAARGGALHALQLRHLRLRAARSSTTCRPARSSTGPRTSSRPCCTTTLPFHCWELESYWNDVGNIEQYRAQQLRRPARARRRSTCPAARSRRVSGSVRAREIEAGVRLEAPILLGAGCLVEAGAELIGPLIIGDGCVIESGAVLEGVIQWDGAKAGRDSRLAGSILGRNVVVHHEAVVHEDAVIGDRSEVAPHTARRGRRPARAATPSRRPRRVRRRRRHGVTAMPRVHAGGALDGLLDLVFPRRCVVLPGRRRLALRGVRRRTFTRCPTTVAGAAVRRCGAPAGRRAPAPARGACRPAASAPAATSPSPPPRRRSATKGRRAPW